MFTAATLQECLLFLDGVGNVDMCTISLSDAADDTYLNARISAAMASISA